MAHEVVTKYLYADVSIPRELYTKTIYTKQVIFSELCLPHFVICSSMKLYQYQLRTFEIKGYIVIALMHGIAIFLVVPISAQYLGNLGVIVVAMHANYKVREA